MIAAFVAIALFMLTIVPSSPGFMGSVGIYYLIGWIVLGVIFYLASAKYRNAVPEEERMATLFSGMEPEEPSRTNEEEPSTHRGISQRPAPVYSAAPSSGDREKLQML